MAERGHREDSQCARGRLGIAQQGRKIGAGRIVEIGFARIDQIQQLRLGEVESAHGQSQFAGDGMPRGAVARLCQRVAPPLQPDRSHLHLAHALAYPGDLQIERMQRDQVALRMRRRDQDGQPALGIETPDLIGTVLSLVGRHARRYIPACQSPAMIPSPPDSIAAAQARENFPVASRLIASALRPAVLAFYRLVRGADDVADSATLAPSAKTARLTRLDAILQGDDPREGDDALERDALALRRVCERHAVPIVHARHLLQAFLADASARPCRSWSDLVAYCRFSAAPVGGFLLDLHGEESGARRASDALCVALQVLNHLQDCQKDWRDLKRCYLPTDWLAAEGLTPEDLLAARATDAHWRVFRRVLAQVRELLGDAAALDRQLADHRLAQESAGILALAQALARKLEREDPLAGRVELGGLRKAIVFATAALRITLRRGAARRSSFDLAMRLFPAQARAPIRTIYALARRVDDIADGPAPAPRKRVAMAAWHAEIDALYDGRPSDPLTRGLLPCAARLPRQELHALIDGLEMDGDGPIHAPAREQFQLYCRRVAGSIGVLVLAACGRTSAQDVAFAEQLGEAFQMVNVLRDLAEDARRGRLYLPAELLREAGMDPAADVGAIIGDPRLDQARRSFTQQIDHAFARVEQLAQAMSGPRIGAISAMTSTYRQIFSQLKASPGAAPKLRWRHHCSTLVAAMRAT